MTVADAAPWWWDSASNFVGVLIGALISSIIAYWLARRSSKEILRRDNEARRETKKAAVFRVSVALVLIISQIGDLHRYLKRQLAKAEDLRRQGSQPWELVMPMAGIRADEVPSLDEAGLAVLFEDNELSLMQDLILLQRRCASAHVSFLEYCRRREQLNEKLPAPTSFDGRVGRVEPTREQVLALTPFIAPLNDLILSLVEHVEKDWEMATKAAVDFTLVARKHLDMPGFTLVAVEVDQSATSDPKPTET